MMDRGDGVIRMMFGCILAVASVSACAGNGPPGWPSRALVTDVPDSTLLIWEAVLQAYRADPGPFHPYGSANVMPVIIRQRGHASVPALWAARLVMDSVVDGVCDYGAMLNCWSDVHARFIGLGMPKLISGDTAIVHMDFTQETTDLCGTEEWSAHQYVWATDARVVATGKAPRVVGDSVVSVSDEVSCSIEPMSAADIRLFERARTLRALVGCYQLLYTTDSAHLVDMRRVPSSWTDTRIGRVVADTIHLDSIPMLATADSDAWHLSGESARDPSSQWTLADEHLQMVMGNFFVLRTVDLWPTMTAGHFEGKAHELTDSSQEYFYTVRATKLDEECRWH